MKVHGCITVLTTILCAGCTQPNPTWQEPKANKPIAPSAEPVAPNKGRDPSHMLASEDQARSVGGLAWALRRNLEGKISSMAGTPYGQLARQFWKDPGEVKRLLEGVSLAELEQQLLALLHADLSVKSGASKTLQSAVERLILARCTLPAAG